MRLRQSNLTILLNNLYDHDRRTLSIAHPSEAVGELVEIELGAYDASSVRVTTDMDAYGSTRAAVERQHPKTVAEDLPTPADYRNCFLGAGLVDPANQDELETFLTRYGDPDLMAGHPPVFAGFDTNLLPWRIDRVLGLRESDVGIGYVNGFILATGVRDELDWEHKCHDTTPFETAFDPVFEAYWNQSLGAARIGRLGLLTYRAIRDIEQAVEIQSDTGDEAIVTAYDSYDQQRRSDIILFSNDRNFVERARAHRLLGQRVEFPDRLPAELTASWEDIERLLYYLAIVFGILRVGGVTIYGIWRGKDELDWQYERLKIEAASPALRERLSGDRSIVDSFYGQ